MFTPETKTIGPFEYRVRPLGGLTARKVLMKIAKVAAAADGNPAKILALLPEDDSEWLFETFMKVSHVKATNTKGEMVWMPLEDRGFFDLHFVQRSESMMAWFSFCFSVNFKSENLPKEQGAEAPGAQEQSTGPKGATPGSGA